MKRPTLLVIISVILTSQAFGVVIWSDEFDGPNIDTSIWTWDAGGHGFGNGQLEYNTALSQNSFIDSGDLVLKAIRENYMGNSFTSARMLTQGRFAFKYGTLEARIKLPNVANGLWPAFWLLGNNFPGIPWPVCGEIDILESGSADGITNGTQNELINNAIHYSIADGSYEYQASWDDASNLIGPVNLNDDYHLYKVEWTPTYLKFYLDGVEYGSYDITAAHMAEFHQPQFPIINIAIGGWNYVQINDPAGITALPTAGSSQELRMDWIRLEDNAFTEVILGADTEEFGNFGILTELTPVDNSLAYGDDTAAGWPYSDEAAVYLWENTATFSTTPATPSEGTESWTLDVGSVGWFGMGVFMPNFRNMTNYSDGFLHFDIQSTATYTMKVGVQSSRGGQFWLPLGDETTEFGFARDGLWHTITVPLNRFANTDFKTVHQLFMLMADVSSPSAISLDNIYWEPSVARPTPANGSFGVYTEDATHKDAGEFALGVDGDFFVWENTLNATTETAYEGTESMTFTSAGAGWFGMAFTPNVKYNLTAFRYPTSKLQFAMKTTATTTFQVGMKSGNVDGVGQKWITFANGSDPYGFVRDGAWHVVEIPMDDILADVDLFEVSQLFQVLGFVDISNIGIDDICFTGGGDPLTTPGGGNIPPTVSITSPANGTFYDPGDDVTIIAEANDVNGTITKVEFFNGAALLAEDACSPYSYTWNSIPEGSYTFTARATDNNDVSRNSSPVTIYVGTPVLASINVSPSSTTIAEGTYTQFTASGLDQFALPISANVNWSVSGGGVIDENGYFVALDAGGPYTVTAQDGAISDTANVTVTGSGIICDYDASGRVDLFDYAYMAWFWTANDCDGINNFCDGADHVQDGDVDIYDAQIFMHSWLKSIPPSVTITSPADGAIFTPGDNVTIDAAVVVNTAGTTITRVEFFEGANYLGQDTTAPYSYTWNSIPQGAFSITAIATDDFGQSSTSAAITIIAATASVVNGGFESGTTTGWTLNNLGGNSTVVSTTESPRTGSYSAKLVTDSTGAGVRAEMLQTVTGLFGSTSYDFDLWVKGLMGVGGVAWAEIKWFNASSGYLGSSGLINLWAGLSNSTYQLRGGTYLTPAGTASAEISIRVEGGAMVATNTMFVDDVSFSN
ncbi:MAG: family 16 glycosylhydrolase [Planctomycetes bacterium]|nr:family 16 glycosylhydrolase [Planctomycetota bacterium]